jgi:GH18 family chitinase
MTDTERALHWLIQRGAPAFKVVLGIPAYCRGLNDLSQVQTYDEVALKLDGDETADVWCNGPESVRSKARFARQQGLAGIFIWELGQDAW